MTPFRALMWALTAAVLTLPAWGPPFVRARLTTLDPLHPGALPAPLPGRVLVVGDHVAAGVGVPRKASWARRIDGGRAALRVAPRLHARDALRQMPQWLAEERPSFVAVQLGADDGAVRPLPWTPAERARAAAWCGQESARPPDPRLLFFGTWEVGGVPMQLLPDGRATLGPRAGRWSVDDETFLLQEEGGAEARYSWRLDDAYRVLSSADGPPDAPTLLLEPEIRRAEPLRAAAVALATGRLWEAEVRIDALRAYGAPQPVVRQLERTARLLGGEEDAAEVAGDPAAWAIFAPTAGAPLAGFQRAELADALDAILRVCRRYGARPVVVGHPDPRLRAVGQAAATEHGVPFVVPGTNEGRTYEHAPGCWNAEGHEHLALRIDEALAVLRASSAAGDERR